MVRKELKKDFEEQYNELLKEEALILKKQRNLLFFIWVLIFLVVIFYSSVVYLNYKKNKTKPETNVTTKEQYMMVTYYDGNTINETNKNINYKVENIGKEDLTYLLKLENITNNSEETIIVIEKNDSPYKEIALKNEKNMIIDSILIESQTNHSYNISFKDSELETNIPSAKISIEIVK